MCNGLTNILRRVILLYGRDPPNSLWSSLSMFLRNTSSHPDEEVKALIKFAAEPYDLRFVCVNVKGSSYAYRGRAYERVPRAYSNAPQRNDSLSSPSDLLISLSCHRAMSMLAIAGNKLPKKNLRLTSSMVKAIWCVIARNGFMGWSKPSSSDESRLSQSPTAGRNLR